MKKSTDGLVWEQVSYFENKSVYCMDYYGDHMVASEVSNIYGIYYSVDGGDNWAQSNGVPMITDMKFDGWGKMCGIFPDLLDSSGLWESDDFGETWEIVFYSENMSSIGFDAFGETFVGWKGDIGIARYDPNAPPPGLIFLNQGLPNLNINRIQINPTMSAPALFVSTEGGVFYSYDYMVGVGEPEEVEISIYPNPAHDQLWVKGEWIVRKIEVLTLAGQKVHEYLVKEKEFGMDISTLDHGIYIVNVETEKGVVSKKVVIR
nr:T9SS type A sorting domain-containing protein [Bacteroidota bacterium]